MATSNNHMLHQYGPWALIAGATDGTGELYAKRLAAAGIHCVLAARREPLLNSLAEQLGRDYGVQTRQLVIDLCDDDAAERLYAAVADLDIGLFVANAGAGNGQRFLDASLDEHRRLININVQLPMAMCHKLAPAMVARGRGGLLLMGSGVALGGQPMVSVYCASKAFGLNLAEALWAELKPKGVDVLNVVAPLINTPKFQRSSGGVDTSKVPGLFEPELVVDTALAQLAIGPCYIFPAGTEAHNADEVTAQRRQRVEAVTEFTKALFGDI